MFSWKKHFSTIMKIFQNDNRKKTFRRSKRTSFFASQKGAMTLEASIILPLFLVVLLLLSTAGEFFMIHGEVAHGLKEATVEACVNEYAVAKSKLKGQVVQKGVAKATFLASVNQRFLNRSGLLGGSNAVVFASGMKLNSKGEYEVIARYMIQKKMPFLPAIRGVFTQKIRQKAMTGYVPGGDEEKEGTVYVTPHESVYHTDLGCTHLALSISADSDVSKYLEGKTHYKACEKCTDHYSGIPSCLFIAKEGDAYHTDLECSGLKRTVQAIDKSNAKGLKPCERCGK